MNDLSNLTLPIWLLVCRYKSLELLLGHPLDVYMSFMLKASFLLTLPWVEFRQQEIL